MTISVQAEPAGGRARRFLRVGELAEQLEVDHKTVWRWIREGRLQAFQTPGGRRGPGHWRIDVDDARAFVLALRDSGHGA